LIVSLTKPIQAHGAEVKEIDIREPTGGDIAACGFPFRFAINDDGSQMIAPEAAAITSLVSRLGNIPRGSVAQLAFADWMECMGAVFSFFGASVPTGGSVPTSSSAASTLPGSGNGIPGPH
jgi:hypothetical protein